MARTKSVTDAFQWVHAAQLYTAPSARHAHVVVASKISGTGLRTLLHRLYPLGPDTSPLGLTRLKSQIITERKWKLGRSLRASSQKYKPRPSCLSSLLLDGPTIQIPGPRLSFPPSSRSLPVSAASKRKFRLINVTVGPTKLPGPCGLFNCCTHRTSGCKITAKSAD